MNDLEKQLLMAGLPGTGKTTFLALLWLAIVGGRTPGVKLADYQDDRTYLNGIGARLQHCDPTLHTELGEDRALKLSLLVGETDDPAVLDIPDLSGETWREAATDRHWPSRVEALATGNKGLLLFMHGREFDAGATIGQVNELTDILSQGSDEGSEATGHATGDTGGHGQLPEGPPSDANGKSGHIPPTQVALVDALQLICEQRGLRPARVSIVISAWDLVGEGVTPREFVAKNLPLLVQYLEANEDWLEVQIFGLSAQGGDFEDADSRENLAKVDAVERAIVQDRGGGDVGVHEIALWALGRS
jgi:hypothetical protein